MSKSRFHISTSGAPAQCVAKQRSCPRGGEATYLSSLGLEGPARPSVREAREHGVREVFYESFFNVKTSLTEPNTNSYEVALEEAKTKIDSLLKYVSVDDDGMQNRWIYSPLSDKEKEEFEPILEIGDIVGGLVRKKIDKEQLDTLTETYETSRSERKKELDELKKKYEENFELYKKGSSEVTLKGLRKELNSLHREGRKYPEDFTEDYFDSVGKAYKSVLEDLGVDFISDDRAEEIMEASDGVQPITRKNTKKSLSCFPDSWLSDSDSDFKVRKFYPTGRTMGNYREQYYDKQSDKYTSLIQTDDTLSTTLHEVTHLVESRNVEIGRGERDFLNYYKNERKAEDGEVITNYSLQTYGVRDDGRYLEKHKEGLQSTGATYTPSWREDQSKYFRVVGASYEVLTTGMEAVFAPQSPEESFIFKKDKAKIHENFVLGTILSSRNK